MLVNDLLNGREISLCRLYKANYTIFRAWVYKRFAPIPDEILNDIYQDAWVTIYQKAINGALDPAPHCSVRTYLFAVGRFFVLKYFKKNKKTPLIELRETTPEAAYEEQCFDEIAEALWLEGQHDTLLKAAFRQLSLRHKQILVFFYRKKYSLKTISEKFRYANASVVGVEKNRGLKKLRTYLDDNGF